MSKVKNIVDTDGKTHYKLKQGNKIVFSIQIV